LNPARPEAPLSSCGKGPPLQRQQREAEALRANLKKRKAQARARGQLKTTAQEGTFSGGERRRKDE
jgi:hypothetical protein